MLGHQESRVRLVRAPAQRKTLHVTTAVGFSHSSMAAMEADTRVPVTVLIGYLGAGKTTLLNRILTEKRDSAYAVIVNEFGELGIDDRLVRRRVDAEEDIFEMNNGCICCRGRRAHWTAARAGASPGRAPDPAGTVRADLSRILNKLLAPGMKPLDGVIVETTGLADPAPVAQTFFVDEVLKERARLDALVTVVDAKHALERLGEVKPEGVENEAVEQVAFADRILLNKCDLCDEAHLARVEAKLRALDRAERGGQRPLRPEAGERSFCEVPSACAEARPTEVVSAEDGPNRLGSSASTTRGARGSAADTRAGAQPPGAAQADDAARGLRARLCARRERL
mmetsp:Transcript_29029/g.86692  ORF Transcript_29029/g.86692 Transcript_29029/m.86692 type:complete len:340 (+) Transcript_29029:38-1057(+)